MRVAAWLLCATLLPALATPARDQPAEKAAAVEPTHAIRLEGNAREVFLQLGQLYGVPLRVADDFPARRIRLRLEPVDFTTALRVAAQLAGAFWAFQPDGSVLLAENTPAARERYEPQTVQTFALSGRSAEELTEAVRLLREILDMRRINLDLRSGTLTIRDTPQRIALAAKLLEQLQAEPGEVLVEMLLLEVDSERARQLGVLPPDLAVLVHIGAGILPTDDPLAFLQALQDLARQGVLPAVLLTDRFDFTQGVPAATIGGGRSQYLVNLPGATLSLRELLRTVRSLRRVTLRTRSGKEASFFAGERFPVTFTTFSSIFIPAVVQELIRQGLFLPPVPAVRYEELGLRLTVHPYIHPGREISLELKLDLVALAGQDFNGIPVLTNRQIEQKVRLREGEVLLLSGMRAQETERVRTGLPLLGAIPVIGHLFRRTAPRTRDTELFLLVTPHIVRLPSRERFRLQTLYIGTEREFSPAGRAPSTPRRLPTPTPTQPPTQPQRPTPQPPQRIPPPQPRQN